MQNRTLFFGDNLEILRKKIPDETFDLIYLDPPFNSNRSYNVLFKEGLQDSPAQVHAFEDTWHWNDDSKHTFDTLVTKTNENISSLMQALEKLVSHNDMLAYLTMMTIRLIELRRVLKKTGSIYLHCDPTASHYLKIILDTIFGKTNFRNEIIWKRSNSPKAQSKGYGSQHDVILFYSKTDNFKLNKVYSIIDDAYSKSFRYDDNDGRGPYQTVALVAGGVQKYTGRKEFEFMGIKAPWLYTKENLEKMYEEKLLHFTKNGGIRKKVYLKDLPGKLVSDIWVDEDVRPLQGVSKESLRFPTQKPIALLERIINAGSSMGDWILDPFCGCGTTVSAAENSKRNWVGIDITFLAINLIKHRLEDGGLDLKLVYVDGEPADLSGARELFKKDPFQFEYWAVDKVNARPAGNKSEGKMKGADKGIDGVMYFVKNAKEEYGKALVQVKGGSNIKRSDVATLKGDVDREKAEAGVFITLENPTKPMIQEAVEAGTFSTPLTIKTSKPEYPKIQILTIEEILKGKMPDLPQGLSKAYYKEASAAKVDKSLKQKLMI